VRRLVVDASVAALWFIGEERSAAALEFVERADVPFVAPDLLPIEVANVLWNASRRRPKPIPVAPVLEHLAGLISYEPSAKLLVAASAIARTLDHPIYDCLYLALVEQENASMITADRRLARKLKLTQFAKSIELLKA
jgi:predicted nucleic acid-binding protein